MTARDRGHDGRPHTPSAREEHALYTRKRARLAEQRVREETRSFDPRPPSDDDWTVDEERHLRRLSRPAPLGEMLERLVVRRGWRERLDGMAVFTHWPEIAGDELVRRCEPVRLAGGTLVVRAESQAWATQLGWMLPQLQQRANEVLGEGMVRNVQVTVGRREAR